MRSRPLARRVAVLTLALLAAGCATRPRAPADVRTPTPEELRGAFEAFARAHAGRDVTVLALSGGGQNGAFGAGVLRGWREAGRPRFDVVSGISTGALQASFAFLDSAQADAELERVYTRVRRNDVFCFRPVVGIPFETSIADFAPLRRLLDRVFDDTTIDRVAAASEGGRRLLLVGTANLDSGRMAVWDLGAIARRRDYATYRTVLLAAASPPIAAEPVSIGGELHVDGSLLGNLFVPDAETRLVAGDAGRPGTADGRDAAGSAPRTRFHVVYNGVLATGPQRVEWGLLPIASRSVDLLTATAGHGSLWYLYGTARARGDEFRYVSIPERLRPQAQEAFAFDPARMRALYDAGVAVGRDPTSWGTEPPRLPEDAADHRGPRAEAGEGGARAPAR